ncbi:MAG: hypothetical protein IJ024_06335 [Lachnospiraceae bacterium]|nr:hypothetical protein [Lachnospiraceae bacterium]
MKKYMMTAVICGCLLIGSLYPRLLLEHHVKLVNENGEETVLEEEYSEEIPLRLEFRFLKFFR